MQAVDRGGGEFSAHAINDVSLLRQTSQIAKIRIIVDGKEAMAELIADGVLVSTPAGSTAYNLSAHGPILPLNAPLMAVTPISAFRPRRWHGALLPDSATVRLEVLEAEKRPVSVVADHDEFRDIVAVDVSMDHSTRHVLLHDPGHSLEERILREQFGY
jgi:NAD+ kinase